MIIKVSTKETFRKERLEANAAGDCAVRAFATFFDCDYNTARKQINLQQPNMDSVRGTQFTALQRAISVYGESRGIEIKSRAGSGTVNSLARKTEKALVVASGHATCVMNGVVFGNIKQEDLGFYKDDGNQRVVFYFTMKVVDIAKYLSGGV